MIKALSICLFLFSLISSFKESLSGQNFELPAEEILKKYLNITGEQLMIKCKNKNQCLAAKVVDLSNEKKLSGEHLINHLVKEAKKLPSITENDWNNFIKNKCLSSSFFIISLEISFGYTGGCLNPEEIPSPAITEMAFNEYINMFCSRVKELSKRKFENGEKLNY